MSGQVLNDDGTLHRFVNVYVNDDDVRYLHAARHPGQGRRRDLDPAGRRRRLSTRPRPSHVPMAPYDSVLDLIGNTPMVDDQRSSARTREPASSSSSRAEPRRIGQGPDRPVARRAGRERTASCIPASPARCCIEPTSGNTGIGLALVCRVKGYHLKVVLPTNVSVERRQLLELWGAEIIESPGSEGSNGAVRMARQLADEHPEWVFLYQYANPANPKAHYEGTGPEIWRDCPDVTHLVAGLGTSGTLLGVGRFLKEQNPPRPGLGGRAAVRRDRRRPAEPRRRLHPADLRGARRPRAARPQDRRPATRVDRVDAPADRGRPVRRHLVRRGGRRRGQVRQPARAGDGRGHRRRLARRRLEVPLDRRVDRRPRRRRRAGEVDHLLLNGPRLPSTP